MVFPLYLKKKEKISYFKNIFVKIYHEKESIYKIIMPVKIIYNLSYIILEGKNICYYIPFEITFTTFMLKRKTFKFKLSLRKKGSCIHSSF